MEQKINIYSSEWCELVFAGKNHDYGAFSIRKLTSERQLKSVLIASALFTFSICSPLLLKKIQSEPRVASVEVNTISHLNTEAEKKDEPKIINNSPVPRKVNSFKFVPPVIKPDNQVKDNDDMKTQADLSNPDFKISIENIIGNKYDPSQDTFDLDNNKKIVEDDIGNIVKVAEQQPAFPGGYDELMKYLQGNIKYPSEAKERGVEGIVYISFIVSKSGKIINTELLRGIDQSCDDEALRVIRSMPDWIPGKQNGMPVSVQFNMPVRFELKN